MQYVYKLIPLVFPVAAVATPMIFELNIHPVGYFVLNYNVVGRSGGPFTAPLIHMLAEDLGPVSVRDGEYLNITTVDNEHVITQSLLQPVPGTGEAIIPIGFQSVFATDFAMTYMMIPSNRQLIINPRDPREFVYGGILTTTRSTSENYPQVQVSVSLLLNTTRALTGDFIPSETIESTAIHEFVIASVEEHDNVPESIIRALYDELERRGIPCDPGYGLDGSLRGIDIFGDLTDEVLETFPILQYRIHGDAGHDVIIQLDGRDYVGPSNDDLRELTLRSGDINAFGLNTLSRIALFIDNRDGTIGFGEPL